MFKSNNKKKLALASSASFLPAIALATSHNTVLINTPGKVENLLNSIADWVLTVFIIVSVIAVIYTAFLYLTAGGDATKVTNARKSLTWAIVAIVIAILAGSLPGLLTNIIRTGAGG